MQQAPEGGFAGRTNKLVDACYSWWVGGCWSLIEASAQRSPSMEPIWNRRTIYLHALSDALGALAKYLLACCQHPDGGLRDKPPMRSDFYHTLYALAGLSATQHHYIYNEKDATTEAAFKWSPSEVVEGQEGDRVGLVHPVFVLPWGDAEGMRAWFVKKGKMDHIS